MKRERKRAGRDDERYEVGWKEGLERERKKMLKETMRYRLKREMVLRRKIDEGIKRERMKDKGKVKVRENWEE